MRIAVYGRSFNDTFNQTIQNLFNELAGNSSAIMIFEPFSVYLSSRVQLPQHITFNQSSEIAGVCDYLLSVGGDGCMLDTVSLVAHSGIPVLGINTGRLGFLSHIADREIPHAIRALREGNIRIEERVLLELNASVPLFGQNNLALNEITIHKKESTSMLTVQAWANDIFLNAYWADGLIIATPTGSTAYSLSCGGPIVAPDAHNFVITPIAPHNLNVRPLILNDDAVIKLKTEGRSRQFMVSLDARSQPFESEIELFVKKSSNGLRLIQLPETDFFTTIRNKLTWGIDKRN